MSFAKRALAAVVLFIVGSCAGQQLTACGALDQALCGSIGGCPGGVVDSMCPMNCGNCTLVPCGATGGSNCSLAAGPGECNVCDDGAGGVCGSCANVTQPRCSHPDHEDHALCAAIDTCPPGSSSLHCPMNCGHCALAPCGVSGETNCTSEPGPANCTVCNDGAGGICGVCAGIASAGSTGGTVTTTMVAGTSTTLPPGVTATTTTSFTSGTVTTTPDGTPTVGGADNNDTAAPTAVGDTTTAPTAAPTAVVAGAPTAVTAADLTRPWIAPCTFPPVPQRTNDYDPYGYSDAPYGVNGNDDYYGPAGDGLTFVPRFIPEASGGSLCGAYLVNSTFDATDILDSGGREQVYAFRVDVPTEITFDSCDSDFDTILSVWDLATVFDEGAVPIDFRDDGGCDGDDDVRRSTLTVILDVGCYAFAVEGYSTEQGNYGVSVSCRSDNVVPTNATQPVACNQTVSGDTTDAPVFEQNFRADLYRFVVANDSQPVMFDACASGHDVVLRIMDASLTTELAFRDDGGCPAVNGVTSLLPVLRTSQLTAGNYTLVVEGYAGQTGAYTVAMVCGDAALEPGANATEGPANQGVMACGDQVSGATWNGNDTLGGGSRELYWGFTLSHTTTVRFAACDADFDTYLRIFNGSHGAPANMSQQIVARDDGGCGSNVLSTRTAIDYTLPPGSYYIIVEGYLMDQGNFIMNMSCHLPEDNATWTEVVECESQLEGYVTVFANYTSASRAVGALTVPSGLHVQFDGCLSSNGLEMSVVNADPFSLTTIRHVVNDSACGDAPGFYRSVDLLSPGTYNVTVSAAVTRNLTHDLVLQYVVNVMCTGLATPSAANLTCGGSVTGTTVGGTRYIGQDSAEVHYALHVNETRTYTFSTCEGTDAEFDTFLHIYTADLNSEVAARDDGGCGGGNALHTSLTYTLDEGSYVVVVEGYRGSEGNFTLAVTCTDPVFYQGAFRGAVECGEKVSGTTETGEGGAFGDAAPFHNYSFTVPASSPSDMPYTFDACTSEFDTVLTVSNATWNATADDGGCETGSYASAIRDVVLMPGATYTVTIDGYNDGFGFFYASGLYFLSVRCGTDAPTAAGGVTAAPVPSTTGGGGGVSTTAPGGDTSDTTANVAGQTTLPASTTAAAGATTTKPSLNNGATGGSESDGSSVTTIVVVIMLIALVVGGALAWRQYRSSGTASFKRVLNNNPNFSPKLLDNAYGDDGEEDIFARDRAGGGSKSRGSLSDDW